MRDQISLNGAWDVLCEGIKVGKQAIPASYLCRGTVTLSRNFSLHFVPEKRYFLHIAGVCYKGEAILNGQKLSQLYPYCDNFEEVTHLLKNGENHLQLQIEDLTADYGPTGGWQDYGGIAWGVWLELLPMCYLKDIHAICTLDESFTTGQVNAQLTLSCGEGLRARCLLERFGTPIGEETQEFHGDPLNFSFSVDSPALWSPEHPALYTLHAFLYLDGELLDEKSIEIGFRKLQIKKEHFYLNGKKFLFKGVARHDQWGEQGFFMSEQQIEDDIRLLKEAGINFVRCAHYPVHPLFPVLCNRYGLFISEEPGLWQQDCSDPYLTSTAIEIMRRTAIRDRNHPCVAFWILGNECALVPEYLSAGRESLLSVDPTRYVTFANDRKPHLSKSVFDSTGLDFYTYHAYGCTPYNIFGQSLEELCSLFSEKPLVFTEWGGWLMDKTPTHIHSWFSDLLSHMENGNLCGIVWWQWQDILQYLRGEPGILEGNLEGLVTADRIPRDMYYVLQELHRRMDQLLMEKQEQAKISFQSLPITINLDRKAGQPVRLSLHLVPKLQ